MGYYSSQNNLKDHFERRWNREETCRISQIKEFPNGTRNLVEQFRLFEQKMNTDWHPNVVLGAAVAGDHLLTDHGVAHIEAVINHAQDILQDVGLLVGYEIFLLLMAIHFHDVGNITGREEHEQKIVDIIETMNDSLPLDAPEKEFVVSIATAHGGYHEGDKDTIRTVLDDTVYDSISIRPKALAAILRFADEISDDFKRSEFRGVEIPHENEVFHDYSKALDPVSIVGNTIKFHFRIPYDKTQNKSGKGTSEVFLYDEILDRMTKCMRELEYCKKYSAGLIKISTLDVTIDILEQNSSFRTIKSASDSFRLTLHGYPAVTHSTLPDYLENDDSYSGTSKKLKYINGQALCSEIKGKEE